MNSVLLHTCCAPCATYVHQWLKEGGFETTGYFFNPNIYPAEEREKRKKCLEYYGAMSNLPVIFVEKDFSLEAGDCEKCYEIRLRATAKYGKENKFDLFSTSLLVSPHQKHELIREVGLRVAQDEGVEFLYHDFRDGYYLSRELAARSNLYRQRYCGCSASLKAREVKYEQVN